MSVKAISSIKTAIHSLLATPTAGDDSDSTPWAEQWAGICLRIVNRHLSIWDTFLQPVLLQRVKVCFSTRPCDLTGHTLYEVKGFGLIQVVKMWPTRGWV